MIEPGDEAPDFALPDQDGRIVELSDYRGQPVVVNCKAGGRSNKAAAIMLDAGFKDVRSLTGGMGRWNSLGYPTAR